MLLPFPGLSWPCPLFVLTATTSPHPFLSLTPNLPPMEPLTLDALPPELLAEVAAKLPPRYIGHFAAVCRATAAAVAGPPAVWARLLPSQLRAAASATAAAAAPAVAAAPREGASAASGAAGEEATGGDGLAAVQLAASPAGLPMALNDAGVPCAVVVLPPDGVDRHGGWPPPPQRAADAPAWRVALPVAAAAVCWGNDRRYWMPLPGKGPAGRDAMKLLGVWWFDVTASVGSLPGGAYEVAVEVVAPDQYGYRGVGLQEVGVVVEALAAPPPRGGGGGWGGGGEGGRPPPPHRVLETYSPGLLQTLTAPAAAKAAAEAAATAAAPLRWGIHAAIPAGPALLVDAPPFRGTSRTIQVSPRHLPWARVVLLPRLTVVAGGGVRVRLACHDGTYKAGAVFGDIWLTPLGGSGGEE